jgi:hypothetical protein
MIFVLHIHLVHYLDIIGIMQLLLVRMFANSANLTIGTRMDLRL